MVGKYLVGTGNTADDARESLERKIQEFKVDAQTEGITIGLISYGGVCPRFRITICGDIFNPGRPSVCVGYEASARVETNE